MFMGGGGETSSGGADPKNFFAKMELRSARCKYRFYISPPPPEQNPEYAPGNIEQHFIVFIVDLVQTEVIYSYSYLHFKIFVQHMTVYNSTVYFNNNYCKRICLA